MTHLSSEFVGTICLTALKIAVLVAVTDLVCRTAWRRWAAMRHLCWTLCIVGMLVVPIGGLLAPQWAVPTSHLVRLVVADAGDNLATSVKEPVESIDSPRANSVEISTRVTSADPHRPTSVSADDLADTAPDGHRVTIAERALAGQPDKAANDVAILPWSGSQADSDTRKATTLGWATSLAAVWLLIAAVLLLRGLWALCAAHALCRRAERVEDASLLAAMESLRSALGVRRPVRLLVSSEIDVPVTFGAWRPCVILPETSGRWDSQCRRVAMLHELAHVKRLDTATQVMGCLATVAFWWHPLTWYAASRQRAEQERACDDMVLANGCRASDYAEHLIQIAQALSGPQPLPSASVAMIRRPSRLRARLNGILTSNSRRGLSLRSTLASTAIGLVMALSIASAVPRATAQDEKDESSDTPARPAAQENAVRPDPPSATDGKGTSLPKHAVRRYGTTGVLAQLAKYRRYRTAVTSDGRLVASVGPHGVISLWDVTADRQIATLTDDRFSRLDDPRVRFSPDKSKLMVVGGATVQMWDVTNKRHLFEKAMENRRRYIIAAVFSPNATVIAVSGEDRMFRIWDANTGKQLLVLPVPKEHDYIDELAFSPKGDLIAWGTRKGYIQLWDVATGEQVRAIEKAHPEGINALVFSPDGRRIYSGGIRSGHYETAPGVKWARYHSEMAAWDVATGERVFDFQPPSEWEGNPMLGLSGDGKILYSLHKEKFAFWDAATGGLKRVIDSGRLGPPVGPADDIITIHGRRSQVLRYVIDSGDEPGAEPAVPITMARLSNDGKLLITAGVGVQLWDAATGKLKHRLNAFSFFSANAIEDLSSEGLVFAVGTVVNRQRAETHSQVRAFERYTGAMQYAVRVKGRGRALAISPDGKFLAVVSRPDPPDDLPPLGLFSAVEGRIEVLEAVTGNRVASLKGPTSTNTALRFAPDSNAIASITGSEFRLWDIKSGEVRRKIELEKHRKIILPDPPLPVTHRPTVLYAAAVSPDLRWAVTTGLRDERVFVWDIEKGTKHADLVIPGLFTSALAISPDSRLLAVSAILSRGLDDRSRNTITVWDILNKRQLLTLVPDPSELPNTISFSADGKRLLSASRATSVILWDLGEAYAELDR